MIRKHLLREAVRTFAWVAISLLMIYAGVVMVIMRLGVPTLRKVWAGVIVLAFIWLGVTRVIDFVKHYRDVREFEKDFLPEKLDELLLSAEKSYCGKHFFLKDRVISLGALAEFDYSDVYWTGVFRQKTYRTAVKPLLLEVRFKNGKHVIMEFPYFSQKSLKAKAFIDERAGIAQENSRN